jgi:hypothetical protein
MDIRRYGVLGKYWLVVALALLSTMVFSCSKSEEKALIENTVKEYNSALVQAYRDAEMSYMNPYATPEQLHRLVSIIQPLKENKHRMRIMQEGFAVESISIDGKTAEVVTQEKWTFWNEDKETLEVLKPKETESYRIFYTLKKEKGKWLVDTLNSA